MAKDERAEQTPEGEGGIVAPTKTARKLQLEDDTFAMVTSNERKNSPSSLPSSSAAYSPLHRSPFRKSPRATCSASCFETDSEISVRKQLFPSNRRSDRLKMFQFSSSKKRSSSAKVGSQNPFALLDQSQKFTGGVDSENKKCFVLTNNADNMEISSQANSSLSPPQTERTICIEIDSDQDTGPSSQNSTGETTGTGGVAAKSGSFSYMTSADFITAHPCTQGQPSVDEKPAVLQRSQSVAEMMLQPAGARANTCSSPLVDLEGNAPLNNRRGSAFPSISNTKVCCPS